MKRSVENDIFGSETLSGFGEPSHQEFQGVPPPPSQDDVFLLHKLCNREQSVKHRIKFRSYL